MKSTILYSIFLCVQAAVAMNWAVLMPYPRKLFYSIASKDAAGLNILRQAYVENDVSTGVIEGLIIASIVKGNREAADVVYGHLCASLCLMSLEELETEAKRASDSGNIFVAEFIYALMEAHSKSGTDYQVTLGVAHEICESVSAQVIEPLFSLAMSPQDEANMVKAAIEANNPDIIRVLSSSAYARFWASDDVKELFWKSCKLGHVEALEALFDSKVWSGHNNQFFSECICIAERQNNVNILGWFCEKKAYELDEFRPRACKVKTGYYADV